MKKRMMTVLVCLTLLFCGCGRNAEETAGTGQETADAASEEIVQETSESAAEEPVQQETPDPASLETETVYATDRVNIRTAPSTDADIFG